MSRFSLCRNLLPFFMCGVGPAEEMHLVASFFIEGSPMHYMLKPSGARAKFDRSLVHYLGTLGWTMNDY